MKFNKKIVMDEAGKIIFESNVPGTLFEYMKQIKDAFPPGSTITDVTTDDHMNNGVAAFAIKYNNETVIVSIEPGE